MQYDAPVTSTELLTSLQANPALSKPQLKLLALFWVLRRVVILNSQ